MSKVIESNVAARIESLHVKNFRTLRDIELKLTPLTVLLGPNGSGKSTVFDVFAFLAECFSVGLRKAWDRRGRFKELRSRGSKGPLSFEIKYRERNLPVITYHLEIDEKVSGPVVSREWLRWTRQTGKSGRPFNFLDFKQGAGTVISGDMPDADDVRIDERLDSPDMLAANTLGQLTKHPRVSSLRRFISGWYLSYLTADQARGTPEAGPQERLSETGDNLPNVIQYLAESHPVQLKRILETMAQRVPRLERVSAQTLADGRLLLQLKDAPFERPILAKWASDGTLKMLAYLTVLNDPSPPPLIGIEEPENQLHPRRLEELAEECRAASERSQMMVTTHSPFFVNALNAEELWVLFRNDEGFTEARRASEMRGINEFVKNGARLGQLWMEGHFEVGDPLTNSGGEKHRAVPAAKKGKR